MLESIDSPQGDQVDRSAATTASGRPPPWTGSRAGPALPGSAVGSLVGIGVRGLVQARVAGVQPGPDQLAVGPGEVGVVGERTEDRRRWRRDVGGPTGPSARLR